MSFDRARLPDPLSYYESIGLPFRERRGKWRTTRCDFHGGSDSLRVNIESGAFVCMAACGARGGDVLAYHMAAHGLDFVAGAKALGAWIDDGRQAPARPAPLPARDALEVLAFEASLAATAAANLAGGVDLSAEDRKRLAIAATRIGRIAEFYS
jgi:hypothetical protein